MAKVITIANNKGGVGKTTSAISLASIFVDWGMRVALIDNDPQGNVGVYLGHNINRTKKTMADVYHGLPLKDIAVKLEIQDILTEHNVPFEADNITVFPSNFALTALSENNSEVTALKKAIDQLDEDYQVVIIDNGPAIGFLTLSALLAADLVLIPTEAGIGAITGISQLISETEAINRKFQKTVMIRIFVNDFQDKDDFDISNLEKLKQIVGDKLYDTYVPTNIHLKRSKEVSLPVNLVERISNSRSRGAKAFRALGKSILEDIYPKLFEEEEEDK